MGKSVFRQAVQHIRHLWPLAGKGKQDVHNTPQTAGLLHGSVTRTGPESVFSINSPPRSHSVSEKPPCGVVICTSTRHGISSRRVWKAENSMESTGWSQR